MNFDLRVTNLGVSWPPLGATVDSVEISGRIVFEKRTAGVWIPVGSDLVGLQVVTPLSAGSSKDFSFQYQVDPLVLPPEYDRARVVFEVNGADQIGSRTVSERTYLNNEYEIVLNSYPDAMVPTISGWGYAGLVGVLMAAAALGFRVHRGQ